MKKKIGIVSLGCPKNLVDSEIMLGILKKENYEITNNEAEANIIIVNTCGFIDSAKQESINSILEMAQYKKNNCEILIVTGCLAERYNEKILQQIPEVDAIVGTGGYGEIAKIIESAYSGIKPVLYGKLEEIDYLDNERLISKNKGSAYLKIAEGCNNCCTYCIIPSLRGIYRSRKIDDILKEAQNLGEKGVKEIILVAQDVTRYGTDLYKKRKLVELIDKLSAIEAIEWIRLLYCYPEEIDEQLINEFKINKKLCKYIDIPIQHSSNKILKLMGRRGELKDIEGLIARLRQNVPEIVIRTSLIVGFPGESDEDFEILSQFVTGQKFDHLGVFTYSKEEGTKAAKMKPQVNKKIKEKRYNEIMLKQKKIVEEKNQKRKNKIYKTLVEGISEDGIFYYGRSFRSHRI